MLSEGAFAVAQAVKNRPTMQETPGSGRCHGEGSGYPLQYSCLQNFIGRGAWEATVHAKSWT